MHARPFQASRKTVSRRFTERTIKREWLGFEAYAWVAQRITGLMLLGFLFMHLYTLRSVLGGEGTYNQTMRALELPLVKVGELFLIWVVVFHLLNGFRLIIYNFLPGLNHKVLAYAVFFISLLSCLLSIPFFF
jgi:succinate dehydrogenase / fumarate reductase cytochrome b subunit